MTINNIGRFKMIEYNPNGSVKRVIVRCLGDPCQHLKKDHSTKKSGGIHTYPQGSKRQKARYQAWKTMVVLSAKEEMRGLPPLVNSAIALRAFVIIPRPKSISVKKRPYPIKAPDADNFFYLNHNVLEGIVYENDSQIVHLKETEMYEQQLHIKPCTLIVAQPYTELLHQQMVREFEEIQAGCLNSNRTIPDFPM